MIDYIDKAKEFIKDYFRNDATGHDYYHSLRVYRLATEIAQHEAADLFTVQLSALLHDVDDRKLSKESKSLFTTCHFLGTLGLPDEMIGRICNIIRQISFKGEDTMKPLDMEGKIVQDADRLDAIGAIGIARAFTYGGSIHRNIYNPDCPPRENMNAEEYYRHNGSTINHFYEKLLKLPTLMNTDTGRLLAERRQRFMEDFLREFYEDWNSGAG